MTLPGTEGLTAFEHDVVRAFLDILEQPHGELLAQLGSARVNSREFTGVGFYTTVGIPMTAPRLSTDERELRVTGVHASIGGLRHGAGFVLYITDGVLDMLEGFTYDEPWPEAIIVWEITTGEGTTGG